MQAVKIAEKMDGRLNGLAGNVVVGTAPIKSSAECRFRYWKGSGRNRG